MNSFTEHVARVLQLPRPAVALQGAGCAVRVAPLALRFGEPRTASLYRSGLDLVWASPSPDDANELAHRLAGVDENFAVETQGPELYVLKAALTLAAALRVFVDDDLTGAVGQFTACASELAQACDYVADLRKKGFLGRPGALLDPFSDAEKAVRERTLEVLSERGTAAADQVRAMSEERAAAVGDLVPRFADRFGLTDRGR